MGYTPRVLIAGLAFFLGFIPSTLIVFLFGNPHSFFTLFDALPNRVTGAIWLLILFGMPVLIGIITYWRLGPTQPPPGVCPKCGSDLEGTQSPTCPECGGPAT